MSIYIPKDYMLIEEAPKYTIDPIYYLSDQECVLSELPDKLKSARRQARVPLPERRVGAGRRDHEEDKTIRENHNMGIRYLSSLCTDQKDEITLAVKKLSTFKELIAEAKLKIRDGGAEGHLKTILLLDGAEHHVDVIFYKRDNFYEVFSNSQGTTREPYRPGYVQRTIKGHICVKIEDLQKLAYTADTGHAATAQRTAMVKKWLEEEEKIIIEEERKNGGRKIKKDEFLRRAAIHFKGQWVSKKMLGDSWKAAEFATVGRKSPGRPKK